MAKNDFYKTSRTEIDLRTEFSNTIYGTVKEIPKGQKGLLRRFRKDSDGKKIKCPCVNRVTGEPFKESLCSYCRSEKYLWDETSIDFYFSQVPTDSQLSSQDILRQPGVMNTPIYVFYIPSTFDLTSDDKIVRLVLDNEGVPVVPNKRLEIFKITALRDMRLDFGRLEFWKANGYIDNVKFL